MPLLVPLSNASVPALTGGRSRAGVAVAAAERGRCRAGLLEGAAIEESAARDGLRGAGRVGVEGAAWQVVPGAQSQRAVAVPGGGAAVVDLRAADRQAGQPEAADGQRRGALQCQRGRVDLAAAPAERAGHRRVAAALQVASGEIEGRDGAGGRDDQVAAGDIQRAAVTQAMDTLALGPADGHRLAGGDDHVLTGARHGAAAPVGGGAPVGVAAGPGDRGGRRVGERLGPRFAARGVDAERDGARRVGWGDDDDLGRGDDGEGGDRRVAEVNRRRPREAGAGEGDRHAARGGVGVG